MTTSHSVPAAAGAPPAVSGKDAGKIARAAFVGTALEWYDYYLFGTAAALVFNRLFFTNMDPTAALLASFATFIAILAWAFSRRRAKAFEDAGRLPFEQD